MQQKPSLVNSISQSNAKYSMKSKKILLAAGYAILKKLPKVEIWLCFTASQTMVAGIETKQSSKWP